LTQIAIGDITGSIDLQISEKSLAAKQGLKALKATGSELRGLLAENVSSPTFHKVEFGCSFDNSSLKVGGNGLEIKAGVNSSLAVARSADSPLFGKDDCDPVAIGANECWVSFELGTSLGGGVAVPLPDGFGVKFQAETAPTFATHVLIAAPQVSTTTLGQAIQRAIAEFEILNTPDDVLSIQPGCVYTSHLAGSVKLAGHWALPIAANQVSLADATLPFHAEVSVNPQLTVKVAGEIELTTEYSVRFRRIDESRLRVGLYRKHGADLKIDFSAGAGVGANIGQTDLIDAFLAAIDPGVKSQSLSPDDVSKFQEVLKDSIDHSLAISMNVVCSAADGDEAAFAYEIDVTKEAELTKAAIAEALHGNWTAVSKLPNGKQMRNLVTETLDKKSSLTLNLLGLYNYRSVADFLKTMKVLRNLEDGSITITDTASASLISSASTALAVDGDRLRAALYRGFIVTAAYKALFTGIGTEPSLSARQDFLLYKTSMAYRDALKQLNAGEVLGAMPPSVKSHLPANGNSVRHARFAASRDYSNVDVMHFFFSDDIELTPRTAADLKKLGRSVLASLLDPQDQTDRQRIQVLQSDAKWAGMDSQPAQLRPPFYSDWYDITEWSKALATAAPLLADVIRYGKQVPGDPTADPTFRQKRAALTAALGAVTRDTRAAFEMAFPICVMASLAGVIPGANAAVFEAEWNSKTITSNRQTSSAQQLTAKL
jgi:hypothetical protein